MGGAPITTVRVNKKSDIGRGVALVAGYCGVLDALDVIHDASAAVPTIHTREEGSVPGVVPVSKAIVRLGSKELQKALLGETAEEEAEVSQWLSWRNTELKPPCDLEQLKPVATQLRKTPFLAGSRLTLADIVAFAAMHTSVAGFLPTEKMEVPEVVRWFDYIQTTVDAPPPGLSVPYASAFKKVAFELPSFTPPPPAPKVAAPAKGKEEGKGKGKEGKEDKGAAPKAAEAPAPAGGKKEKGGGKGGGDAAAAPAGGKKEAAAAAAAAAAAPAEGGGGKKEKKEKKPKELPTKKVVEATIDALNIRVGKVTKVWKHPDADALYCEEIDVGEGKPRVVVSGLAKHVPEDQFNGMLVCVLSNVKPGNVRGQPSTGLVLCASTEDKTWPVQPPAGCEVGEKVSFEGHGGEPEAQLNPKKKVFENLQPDLKTDGEGVAGYKGVAFMTSKGPCKSTVANGMVK